jgi:hypothetical protein
MSRRVAALGLLLMQLLERGGAGVHRRDPTAALEQRAHCGGGPQVRLRGGGLTMHEWIILPAKDLEVVACVVHAPRV